MEFDCFSQILAAFDNQNESTDWWEMTAFHGFSLTLVRTYGHDKWLKQFLLFLSCHPTKPNELNKSYLTS